MRGSLLLGILAMAVLASPAHALAPFKCPTVREFLSTSIFRTKAPWRSQCFEDSAYESGCLSGGNYLGCYEDWLHKRTLHTMTDAGPDINQDLCAELARNVGNYPQWGIQAGHECYVGDFRGNINDVRPESECDARCSGDATAICGGRWRTTLFDLPPRRPRTCHWSEQFMGYPKLMSQLITTPSLSLGGGRTPVDPEAKKPTFPKDFIKWPRLNRLMNETDTKLPKGAKKWPKVSVITPTYDKRHAFHPRLYASWLSQTYHKLGEMELLIIDDGDKYQPRQSKPNPYLIDLATREPRVWYEFANGDRLSIGEKRNWLNEHATGEIIVQFDDDDFYHPKYIETMVRGLIENKADLIKLCSYFIYGVYEKKFIYVDQCDSRPNAYGFSYVYKKALYNKGTRFQDKSLMEDDFFLNHAEKMFGAKIHYVREQDGMALKVVTGTGCTGMPMKTTGDVIYDPLPPFLVGKLFGSTEHISQWLRKPY